MTDYKPKENYPGFDKDLDMEGVEIKDIAEPSADDSAATKKYVDDTVAAAEIAVTEQALAATLADYALIADYTTTEDLEADYALIETVDGLLKKATVTVTANQIKALNASPKTLIAAPSAGETLIVERVLFRFNWGTTQYTGGSALSVLYAGGSTNLMAGTLAATFITAPTTAVTSDAILAGLGTQLAAPQETAVTLKAAAAEFADGDSTLEVQIWYRVAAATA